VIEFRALGPLAARSAGESLLLGGPKQRMVLALLLVDANRATSIDKLIDGVWGERPPSAARHTVQGYVSELRKVLEGQPERDGAGYVVHVAPAQFDVLRFEELCAAGRRSMGDDPVAASEQLSVALGCWDGTPYADLVDEPALDGEVRRLTELRLEALEDRIESNLMAGLHRGVSTELESLVREHPFRERFWRQLMLALYRSGRQAEALRAYGRVRGLLAEELGISPSPELDQLQRQILEQDVALQAPERPAIQISPSSMQIVGGYELRQVIGEGDFGVVHSAYQPSVGRRVAIKVIRPEYAGMAAFVQRFEAEEQFVAQLEHPHIVPLYDYWRDPAGGYLVMPYLRGGSLATALRRGPWNAEAALALLDQVGSALSYAHREGIVHRDVKPSNVLLDADGNAYLSDFGLSVRLTDAAGTPLTSSAEYLPPEAIRGEPLSAAADIFGLAVLTFELLTSVRPAGAGAVGSIAEVRPHLPVELGAVLTKATDDSPARRHQRVEDFVHDVRHALGAGESSVTLAAPPASGAPRRNPYKGLRPFHETDAVDFHGRDRLVGELVEAVAARRLVCVVGPSGCGKSSVVRAGLIPALRAGSIPGAQRWFITDMFPGSYPFEDLETALLRVAVDDPGGLVGELRSDDRGLLRVIKRILPVDDGELVLVVDQFEELFSMVTDESVRRGFLESLTAALTDERSRVHVIVTLRADFLDRPLDYPGFGKLVSDGLVAVPAPDEAALAAAITGPAHGVGLTLEAALAKEIIGDVLDEPGSLPMLQFALTELFQRREGDVLTTAAYTDSGGVAAALGRRAVEIYDALPVSAKEAARQLFLRLVNVDEETDDTRRRVRRSELDALDVDHSALNTVIEQFAAHRLLTFDRDPISRTPTVEVAHEALIREWRTLRGWVEDQRENLVLHRRFAAAVRDWEDRAHDDNFLLTGGRLQQFGAWAAGAPLPLTSDERTFLERSTKAERRRRRRRTILLIAAAALLTAITIVALVQRQSAQREARNATVRELAGASTLALAEDPERSVLLGLRAVDISREAGDDPSPAAVGALNDAVQTSRLEQRLPDGAGNVAISPDGALLATDVYDSENLSGRDVVVWDADSGGRLRTLESDLLVSLGSAMALGAEGGRSLAFSPSGDLLAVAYRGVGEGTTGLIVWDPRTGEQVTRLEAPGLVTWNPTWSPDGHQLTAASFDGSESTVTTWEVPSARVIYEIRSHSVGEIALYDDDTLAITHGPEHRVGFYDLATGDETGELSTPGLEPLYLAVDHEHHRLAVSARHEQLEVWDVEARRRLWDRQLSSSRRLVIDPSGETLALTGAEGMVRLLDLTDASEHVTLLGHTSAVGDAVFTPDGDRFVSVGNDGETRIWSVAPGGPPALGAIHIESGRPFLVDFSPDGQEIGVSTWEGTFERRDPTTGQRLGLIEGLISDPFTYPVVSPDWRLVAGVTEDGQSMIWNLATGEPIRTLPPCSNPRAFSPDGSALVLGDRGRCPSGAATDGPASHNQVIDVDTGAELLDLRADAPPPLPDASDNVVFRAAFNPGGGLPAGRYLAVNFDTRWLDVYDLETGTRIARFENLPNHLRFDPTGRYLATGTVNDVFVLDLVDLVNGSSPEDAVVFDQFSAPGVLPGVAITSSGLVAVSAFDSDFIRIWDVNTGDLVAELRTGLDGASPPHLNFASDGSYLLYPDAGQLLRRFPLDVDVLVELAETRVSRELTDAECRRHLDADDCS
jgi:DNA-binding SARP family transcriptional activator/WD40 repeat protein